MVPSVWVRESSGDDHIDWIGSPCFLILCAVYLCQNLICTLHLIIRVSHAFIAENRQKRGGHDRFVQRTASISISVDKNSVIIDGVTANFWYDRQQFRWLFALWKNAFCEGATQSSIGMGVYAFSIFQWKNTLRLKLRHTFALSLKRQREWSYNRTKHSKNKGVVVKFAFMLVLGWVRLCGTKNSKF